MKYCC